MELSQGGNAPFPVSGHIPLRRGSRYTGQLGCLMVHYFWLINQKKLQTVVELGDRDAQNAAEQEPLNPQAKTTTEAA